MTQMNSMASSKPARPWLMPAAAGLLVLFLWTRGGGAIQQMSTLMISTLVSEDLTCIAAGQLIRQGDLSTSVGVIGCFLGIFLGDMGLWLVGRLVRSQLITWPRVVGLVDRAFARLTSDSLNQRVGMIALTARFVPGLRLPTYLAMGAAGVGAMSFGFWTFMACLIWTPLVVLLVAHLGGAILSPLQMYLGEGVLIFVGAIAIGILLVRIGTMLTGEIGRAKLIARVSKIWRWEFWPSWLFYLPLLPWIGWLAVRWRGLISITAANPGIEHGGFVGESKYRILSSMKSSHVSATYLIRAGDVQTRVEKLDRLVRDGALSYPLVIKPDAGQRGAGVKLVRDSNKAADTIGSFVKDVVVQPYHPGPFEAGIFYCRMPGDEKGWIFSITDKQFSEIVGDGVSTIEQLIWRHPRFRMQAQVFLTRHAADAQRVLRAGESFRLAMAGNHCQGTLFRDGSHLISPALEKKIDEIARTFDGFYFGRFDVRYTDPKRFVAGEDFVILELNGVTSESTNLYDPSFSLLQAYRILFRQWSLLFQIGAANRRMGRSSSSLRQVVADSIRFYQTRDANLLAD